MILRSPRDHPVYQLTMDNYLEITESSTRAVVFSDVNNVKLEKARIEMKRTCIQLCFKYILIYWGSSSNLTCTYYSVDF